MKILFISRLYSPHVGGVEKHIAEVSKLLRKKGNNLTVLTEKHDSSLRNSEIIDGINVVRFDYPHVRFFGLLNIWWQILARRKLIVSADIIHIHDVFIWYLPFRFLYPNKKVFTTAHGLEFNNPRSRISIWQKKLAAKLSVATIGVGKYLEKYSGVNYDLIIYGAVSPRRSKHKKIRNSIVYVGRLDEDTGLGKFLEWARKNPKYSVEFCGDGPLRKKCEKIGKVYGFITNPTRFMEKSEYCVPGGYMSALEALNLGCKLKPFWNSEVRRDIWRASPFVRKDAITWARAQTWDKLVNEYINLYNHI